MVTVERATDDDAATEVGKDGAVLRPDEFVVRDVDRGALNGESSTGTADSSGPEAPGSASETSAFGDTTAVVLALATAAAPAANNVSVLPVATVDAAVEPTVGVVGVI